MQERGEVNEFKVYQPPKLAVVNSIHKSGSLALSDTLTNSVIN